MTESALDRAHYDCGYQRVKSQAEDWPANRVRALLRRRLERLETIARYDPDRTDYLQEAASIVDALTDRIIALEGHAA